MSGLHARVLIPCWYEASGYVLASVDGEYVSRNRSPERLHGDVVRFASIPTFIVSVTLMVQGRAEVKSPTA